MCGTIIRLGAAFLSILFLVSCVGTINGGFEDASDAGSDVADGYTSDAGTDLQGDGDAADASDAGGSDDGDAGTDGDGQGDASSDADSDACVVGDDPGAPYGLELYVSPLGAEDNTGGEYDPFLTLAGAFSALRTLRAESGLPEGGVVIWLREGLYEFSETLILDEDDSGNAEMPVVISAYPCEEVRLSGGAQLEPEWFELVTESSDVWDRVDPAARGHLLQADLGAQGITAYGELAQRGFGSTHLGALELFVDGEPMRLGRWPDATADQVISTHEDEQVVIYGDGVPDVSGVYERSGTADGVNAYQRQGLVDGRQYRLYRHTWDGPGYTSTAWFITVSESGYPDASDPYWYRYEPDLGEFRPSANSGATGNPDTYNKEDFTMGFVRIRSDLSDTQFGYYDPRPERWESAEDPWAHGYWDNMWADRHLPIQSVDPASRTITLANSPIFGISVEQPYYAYNLLEEITEPGEYYLNRSTGILYLYPPDPLAGADVHVSMLEAPLVHLRGASHITIQNLIFEMTRDTLLEITDGDDNTIQDCVLRNVGATAVFIKGYRNRLERCRIHGIGDAGVEVNGGSRLELIPAENVVTQSEISDFGRWTWTYKPAVRLNGVGQGVYNNKIHHAPHSAILYSGNDHYIGLNELFDVCRFSSDAGVIYAGRHWGYRGNEISHNFIHHIESYFEGFGVHGVYLDDCLSGIHVHGNIFYRVAGHAIAHGGGRDNIMENNIMVDCGGGLASDSRALTKANNNPGDGFNFLETLGWGGIDYQAEPWASAYPALAAIPNDWDILSDPANTWLYPEACVFSRNIGHGNGTFMRESNYGGTGTFDKFAEIADNLEDEDPLFVDKENLDMRLRTDSPAWEIPGFQEIPFEQIGLQDQ